MFFLMVMLWSPKRTTLVELPSFTQTADFFEALGVRQGLLIYEVVHAMGKPQAPIVGKPITDEEVAEWSKNPRGFVAWLRKRTLSLGGK